MSTGDSKRRAAERDAEALKKKFGPFAEVYAESRSEAADIAGDDAGEEHWAEVANRTDDADKE